MRHPLLFAVVAVILASLAGCAGKASRSGFLEDYSQLKKHPTIDGALVYRSPDFDLSRYDKFIIDPIGIQFAPESQDKAVDPKVLTELTTYFHDQLVSALSRNYTVVEQPGPGVMRLRIALTDLKKAIKALNIHPATKLSGVGLGGAAVEAQGVDAGTGQVLFAFMHTRQGNRLALVEGLQDWGHARQAMDAWVKALVDRLDEAHGVKKSK